MNRSLARTVAWLTRAESDIALLERTRPLGLVREIERLVRAWEAGSREVPVWRYARPPNLDHIKRELSGIVDRSSAYHEDATWLVGRAQELLLEVRLVESIGQSDFAILANERFPLPRGKLGTRLEAMARRWLELGSTQAPCAESTYLTDDRHVKESLWSILSTRMGSLRIAARLRIDPKLVAIAACGEDFIVIRGGARLTERAARRIAEHEIVGHLLPRLASRSRSDVLRCGCPRAAEHEEGRALLLERRLGLMDTWRCAELGARHLGCVFLRKGASFSEAVHELRRIGAPTELAIRSVVRASRGGGLGREIIYLPAMLGVAQAFERCAALEHWFELGRASLEYAEARQAKNRAA